MSGFKSFAQQPGRPGSAQSRRPTSASRQEIAARAKAQVPRTGINSHEPSQQYLSARGQSISNSNPSTTSRQELGIDPAHNAHVKHDPYDTDAGSIDTTARDSIVQVNKSQETERSYDESDYDEEGEGDNEDGHGAESDSLPWDDDEIQVLESAGLLSSSQQKQFRYLVSKGIREPMDRSTRPYFLGGEDSYPTTTSGIPESTSHGLHGDRQYESDAIENEGDVSPSPRHPAAASMPHRQLAEQPLHLPERSAAMISTIKPEANIFQQSATIRVNNRFDADLNAKVVQNPQEDVSLQSQPLSYSQVARQPNLISATSAAMRQNSTLQSYQMLPQRRASGVKSIETPISTGQPAQANQRIPTILPTPQRAEEEHSILASGPRSVEDYDRPTLFGMDYSQLSKEDFDTVPRAPPAVIPDDMYQKPLAERLEYVKWSLDTTDQGKFFSSLSTAEWEDAGDWFLDQFSAIISRTKEARQSKRKLAIEFENEVEERHKRITKKQRQVDVSLDNMKARGKGLIPKSPGRRANSSTTPG